MTLFELTCKGQLRSLAFVIRRKYIHNNNSPRPRRGSRGITIMIVFSSYSMVSLPVILPPSGRGKKFEIFSLLSIEITQKFIQSQLGLNLQPWVKNIMGNNYSQNFLIFPGVSKISTTLYQKGLMVGRSALLTNFFLQIFNHKGYRL